MKLSIKDEVLAICAQVGAARSDVVWHKGDRGFVAAIGTGSTMKFSPTWHFPRGVPWASADWRLVLRNKPFERTYRAVVGEHVPFLFNEHFASLDPGLRNPATEVIEIDGPIDLSPQRPPQDRIVYLHDLPDWLNIWIDIGWRLAAAHVDAGSDAGVLRSAKPMNAALFFQPKMVLADMMLGDRNAAARFMAAHPGPFSDRHDLTAIEGVRILAAGADRVPRIAD